MFNKLSISQRITLSLAAFSLPLGALFFYYVRDVSADLSFTAKELQGNTYLTPLVGTLASLNEMQLQGEAGNTTAMQENIKAVDAGFATLESLQPTLGADLQFTDEGLAMRKRSGVALAGVQSRWQALKEQAKNGEAASLAPAYDALMKDVQVMVTHAGDTSNLILDPDLDSYYVMDMVLLGLPAGIDHLHSINMEVVKYGNGNLAANETAARMAVAANLIQQDLSRMTASVQTAISEDANFYGKSPTLESSLTAALSSYTDSMQRLQKSIEAVSAGKEGNVNRLLEEIRKTHEATLQFWKVSNSELQNLLQERYDQKVAERNVTLGTIFATLFASLAVSIWVMRSITRPLKGLQNTMLEIASGNLERVVPYVDARDEIGEMARTLEQFKGTSQEARKLQDQQSLSTAQRLERQTRIEGKIQEFNAKIKEMLSSVNNASASLANTGNAMVGDAEQVSSRSRDTAGATSETAETVSAVAAGAEELSAAIQEISRQVSRAANITHEAVEKTASADGTVQHLTNSAQKIGEIIGMISNIAEQINLLALNATIESARAGEAGKGFAVVASEVKSLASQTSKAADAIVSQIGDMQSAVQQVVQELNQIRVTIDEMNGVSTTIASAVEEQGAATQEIARNIQVASDRVRLVSANVGEVMQMSDNTNTNARQVLEGIQLVSNQSGKLNTEVTEFLEDIARA